MTRRLSVDWPNDRGSASANQPVRLLAVSDEVDRALESPVNRDALGRIDLIIGCGDLEPVYLAMLGDAFRVPLVYVRGNHDRGNAWQLHGAFLPEQLPDAGVETLAGIKLIGLSWPGSRSGRADHNEGAAWRQVLKTGIRCRFRRGPWLVISHAPPLEAGDDPTDPYHRGFRAYRWLARQLRPTLWLHGHTTVATSQASTTRLGPTTIVNVTGSTLIELVPTRLGTTAAAGPADQEFTQAPSADPAPSDARPTDPAPAGAAPIDTPSAPPDPVASAGPRSGG